MFLFLYILLKIYFTIKVIFFSFNITSVFQNLSKRNNCKTVIKHNCAVITHKSKYRTQYAIKI